MATPDGRPVEHRLREALTPPPERVEKIVRHALAAGGETEGGARVRGPRRLVPAVSLLALLTVAAVVLSHFPRPHPSPPSRRESVVSIVNVGGVVIASSREEQRPLILSGTSETDPPGIILIRHGDQK
jgi:hypothetical protein